MRGAAAAVVVAVALVAGCGGGPDERERLVDDLESDFDMPAEQAECVADQLYERFSDDEVDALREADDAEDVPEDLLDELRAALTPCASAGS